MSAAAASVSYFEGSNTFRDRKMVGN
jgi:hypothetical protein